MAFNTALVTANGNDNGYELHQDLLLGDQEVTAADVGATGQSVTADQFRRDLLSVDPADGSITQTLGTDAATKAEAATPDVPAGEVVLAVGVMTGDGTTNTVDSIELDRTGEDSAISGDESHVA